MIITRSFALLLLALIAMTTAPARTGLHVRTASADISRRVELSAYSWALSQHGKPYEWGGTGPYAYDCSGLVVAAFAHAGERLPRSTYDMLASATLAPTAVPRRGDLAFYGSGHVEFFDVPGATYGAHEPGTRVGWTIYNWWYHPTAFYRVSAGGISLAALVTRSKISTSGGYTVRRGDTLWSIAARELGSPLRWPALYAANRGVIGPDPDVITAGQRLSLTVPAHVPPPRRLPAAVRVSRAPAYSGAQGGTLGCGQLEQLWESAGGAPGLARTMAGIAMAESGGREYAAGDGGHSLGYWQIDGDYSSLATYDPVGNARAAVTIEGENGLGAWSTYSSGASAQWC